MESIGYPVPKGYEVEYAALMAALIGEYRIGEEERPHYRMLIHRAVMVHLLLNELDRGGIGKVREYLDLSKLLGTTLDQLMRYTEAVHIETNLRDARAAQEMLKSVIREQLCDECLERVRKELVNV